MNNDHVDLILAQWQRERPDLDPSPMGVIGRIARLSLILGRALEDTFAEYGLSRGEFDVLATLLRSGPPYALTPTMLFRDLMLSSGAMTNRLDRLERAGLVQRTPDPSDRRGTLIGLTSTGQERVSQALVAHVANETRLLAGLSPAQRTQLATLLRVLLLSLGDTTELE